MSPRRRNPNNNHNLSNTKRTGERSEAAFLYQATQRSFGICKLWGDSERYDFSTTAPSRMFTSSACKACPERALATEWVKCTDSLRAGAYETRATYTTGKGRAVCTQRDIDFIAAHACPERSRRIIELDIWYIIPVEVCSPAPMLRFYPHRKAKLMRLEKYREAWHLLDPPLTIHACVDPDYPELEYEV
jgi:hypothetical protein